MNMDRNHLHESGKAPGGCCAHDAATAEPGQLHIDPVCGMKVAADPEKSVQHAGEMFYFCCQGCASKFRADPEKYLHRRAAPPGTKVSPSKSAQEVIYTCPMHPEVRQRGPGTCPKCGMALEPLHATAQEDTSELDDMKRRFWTSVVLTVPLLALTMSEFV